ncbi:DUF349 domain-containing protein [Corynebacterium pseudodiphtheriticum]|uniref:DUF349 domain-containing protein n=1 Tax=Corynebacterium pseudodiphtheriticum TaxID=37637 RepID=UPI003AF2700C
MTQQHTPNPTPASIPKPGPRPHASARSSSMSASTPTPVPVSAPITSNPEDHGYISTDGTVYLTSVLAGSERVVGYWQAGSKNEGLAHYGAKFDELATQAEVLETRLRAHPHDAAAIARSAQSQRETLHDAAVIGNLPALDERLAEISKRCDDAAEQAKRDQQHRATEAKIAKDRLATEAEGIADNSTEWKAAGNRLRAILEEWKSIKGLDRATDDELWKRFSRARDAFHRRRGAHFADLDKQRAQAQKSKELLVEKAEALQNSTDWSRTAGAYRDLMREWKASGRAPRGADDALWTRFRAAQDHFFSARDAEQAAKDEEFAQNAEQKDALLAHYDELIDPSKGISSAREKLRELQEKWDAIGFVPRNQVRTYEDKIAAIEARVAEAEDAEWKRTDPEAQARIAQFQAKVDDFTAQADAAQKAGKQAKAENLRHQAEQWREWTRMAEQSLENPEQ